jgi:hypothetical protein
MFTTVATKALVLALLAIAAPVLVEEWSQLAAHMPGYRSDTSYVVISIR